MSCITSQCLKFVLSIKYMYHFIKKQRIYIFSKRVLCSIGKSLINEHGICALLEWISPEITVKSLTSPSYPLNLPRHSLSTPRHPLMVTPECTDYSLTSPEVYPVYLDYPLRCPEKPMSALRTPWHPLMVTPDGPNYPLTFPEGHLRSLKTHRHPLRCEGAFLDTKIFVLSLGKRLNVVIYVT